MVSEDTPKVNFRIYVIGIQLYHYKLILKAVPSYLEYIHNSNNIPRSLGLDKPVDERIEHLDA